MNMTVFRAWLHDDKNQFSPKYLKKILPLKNIPENSWKWRRLVPNIVKTNDLFENDKAILLLTNIKGSQGT